MLSNYGNYTRLLKIENMLKSVVFTNTVGKNSRHLVGVFNKTITPLALVGYDDYSHLITNAHSWNNCYIDLFCCLSYYTCIFTVSIFLCHNTQFY